MRTAARWLGSPWFRGLALLLVPLTSAALAQQSADIDDPVFVTSDKCLACHSDLVDGHGDDVSIGYSWRATMMAHSAKDPYWHAGVRREITDHPQLQTAIEDKCSTCHMPMARTLVKAQGASGPIFDHLDGTFDDPATTAYAWDGVSCSVCHQIREDNFGEHSSFDGGYSIDTRASTEREIIGPYDIEAGHRRIMKSASGFSPAQAEHMKKSELCATCHTLFTTAYDDDGRALDQFPEQVPYLEWAHSSYRDTHSCQDCHMPEVASAPISSVLGEPREGLSQHAFRGGNAFMLRLLNKYRDELHVVAPPEELDAAATRTIEHLQSETARLEIEFLELRDAELILSLLVHNLTGHKLPTAYPSRRVWLHVIVRDQDGTTVFESGAPKPDGSIAGNDNDANGAAFEPHYEEIVSPDQVQIFEPVIVDDNDEVTTGLLKGVRYIKDNRLLPTGFDKGSAGPDIAVQGKAREDSDFLAGGDRVGYRIKTREGTESVMVSVSLVFQTIGHRWAQNLGAYDVFETRRAVRYYEANAAESWVVLATTDLETARSGASRP